MGSDIGYPLRTPAFGEEFQQLGRDDDAVHR
jgi:hypothetical protein